MKSFVRLLLMAALLFFTLDVVLFAQVDSTAHISGGGIFGFLKKIPAWVVPGILGLYELIVRLVPTVKNYSVLSLIISIIQMIFPNKKSSGGTFTS